MINLLTRKARRDNRLKIGELVQRIEAAEEERRKHTSGREGYGYFKSEDELPQDSRADWEQWKLGDEDFERKLTKLRSELGAAELEEEQFEQGSSMWWRERLIFWPSFFGLILILHLLFEFSWLISAVLAYSHATVTRNIERNSAKLDRVLAILVNSEARVLARETDMPIEDARLEVEELRWV